MFRGRRRGQNYGVFLLFMQLMNYGFNRIPPVTLVAILGQVAIFLGFGDLDRWFGSVQDVCISTHLVLRQKQWTRLILGALLHADDMRLYFNMISLLWKGVTLEKKFKSQYFGFLLAVFTVLTSVTLVLLNWVISEFTRDRSYGLTCAVGFSGVIFALKVLTTHYTPAGRHYALGFIPVPSKYIYWVELGLIQLIYPNASFTGHLAGILVGLLYIKGPLKQLMDSVMQPGYVRARRENTYNAYTGGMSEEEQMRRATEESRRYYTRSQGVFGNQNGGQQDRFEGQQDRLYPDLDELRRRRADRFS